MAGEKYITFEQLQEFAERSDERLDALEVSSPVRSDLTLSSGNWTNDSGDEDYPYQYVLTVEGVTAASRVDAELDDDSIAVATASGMCSVTKTAENAVIFKSYTCPAADLMGFLYIYKSAARKIT